MPIKKRLRKEREHRLSPEAVAAFRGEDRETLHRALGLRPWEISPLDAHEPACPYPGGSAAARTWEKVREIRAELERAASNARSRP